MSTKDIESLSFSELKEQRDPLIVEAKKEPVEVLATRYVKAVTDAKQRDEKLGEQGKTITALQDALEAVKAQLRQAADDASKQAAEYAGAVQQRDATITQLQGQVAIFAEREPELAKAMKAEMDRANRLKTQASQGHAAMSQAAKLLNDALAARAIDAADSGE